MLSNILLIIRIQVFLWYKPGSVWWFGEGVTVFFLISGLLVFKSCKNAFKKNRNIKNYFLNRFLRVAPAIYFYCFVTVGLLLGLKLISFSDLKEINFIGWLISNVALIPVYNPQLFDEIGIGILNGSLWTIPIQVSFYVIVPLLVILLNKIKLKRFSVLIVGVSILTYLINSYLKVVIPENIAAKLFNVTFIPYLFTFSLGIIFGEIWEKLQHKLWMFIISLGLYFLTRYLMLSSSSTFHPFYELILIVIIAYMVFWLGFEAPILFRKVNKYGDFSYGLYIWHMIVLNIFIEFEITEYFKKNFINEILISVVLLLSFIMSYLSWNIIEKNALKLKKYSSKIN